MPRNRSTDDPSPGIAKAPTGCAGLDEITRGGLPAGRPTLVCGGPGCGKTVLAMEFLVRGALEFGEPGLFVSFEESPHNLNDNFRALGFDLGDLVEQKKLKISHVECSRGEVIETGEFSLDGLLIRLEQGISEIGAKRVVLDTMEAVFSGLSSTGPLRREIARLFQWLREKGLTTVITGERGDGNLTRHGLEEYVSDCVLLLDHRVTEQISKRRLRIVKYRGSAHGADEYPFVIKETGFSVLPITSVTLEHAVGAERVSTGIEDLDEMCGGEGYFRGSTILVSGKAGTGKSSLCAAFVSAACERGERCLYLALEESADQLTRNMRSVGIELAPWIDRGLLTVHAVRPTFRGLEEHLIAMTQIAETFQPTCMVLDPITNFMSVGDAQEVKSMLTRVLDYLKSRRVTLLTTALTPGSGSPDETQVSVSSMTDTWISLDLEFMGGGGRREVHIIKSRGMEHSLETRELVMSSEGLTLRDLPFDPIGPRNTAREPRVKV